MNREESFRYKNILIEINIINNWDNKNKKKNGINNKIREIIIELIMNNKVPKVIMKIVVNGNIYGKII